MSPIRIGFFDLMFVQELKRLDFGVRVISLSLELLLFKFLFEHSETQAQLHHTKQPMLVVSNCNRC